MFSTKLPILLIFALISLFWNTNNNLCATAFSVVSLSPLSTGLTTLSNSETRLWAGPAILEPPVEEKVKDTTEERVQDASKYKKGGWAVRLFNDPMNKREFVAMCLSKIVGLTDGQAYQVMMQAHQNGVSVVGRYDLERAELYRDALCDNGLSCDMIPVEDD